jgi:hypothetical protein
MHQRPYDSADRGNQDRRSRDELPAFKLAERLSRLRRNNAWPTKTKGDKTINLSDAEAADLVYLAFLQEHGIAPDTDQPVSLCQSVALLLSGQPEDGAKIQEAVLQTLQKDRSLAEQAAASRQRTYGAYKKAIRAGRIVPGRHELGAIAAATGHAIIVYEPTVTHFIYAGPPGSDEFEDTTPLVEIIARPKSTFSAVRRHHKIMSSDSLTAVLRANQARLTARRAAEEKRDDAKEKGADQKSAPAPAASAQVSISIGTAPSRNPNQSPIENALAVSEGASRLLHQRSERDLRRIADTSRVDAQPTRGLSHPMSPPLSDGARSVRVALASDSSFVTQAAPERRERSHAVECADRAARQRGVSAPTHPTLTRLHRRAETNIDTVPQPGERAPGVGRLQPRGGHTSLLPRSAHVTSVEAHTRTDGAKPKRPSKDKQKAKNAHSPAVIADEYELPDDVAADAVPAAAPPPALPTEPLPEHEIPTLTWHIRVAMGGVVPTLALHDSGSELNVIRHDIYAIVCKELRKHGRPTPKLHPSSLTYRGIKNDKPPDRVLGTAQLRMYVDGSHYIEPIFAVVKHVDEAVVIGCHVIDQHDIHREDANTMRIVIGSQKYFIPCQSTRRIRGGPRENIDADIAPRQDITLRPRTVARILCERRWRGPAPDGIEQQPDTAFLTVNETAETADYVIPGAYDDKPLLWVALHNTSSTPWTIKAGTPIATATRCDPARVDVTYAKKRPARVNRPPRYVYPTLPKPADSTAVQMTDQQRDELRRLMEDNRVCFDEANLAPQHVCDTTHVIKLKDPQAPPVRARGHNLNPQRAQLLQQKADELEDLGMIEDSYSAWCAPALLIKKPDGDTRFVVDFRLLNERSEGITSYIPTPQEMLDKFHGKKVFSRIDLKQAYYQCSIDPSARHLTAFWIPGRGLKQFTALPMGLKNSVVTFHYALGKILEGLQNVFHYLDDIIVASETPEQHLRDLRAVFQRLAARGLRVSAKKCTFFQKELAFLGHIVGTEGIRANPDKISALANFPEPTTQKACRAFVSAALYYQRFYNLNLRDAITVLDRGSNHQTWQLTRERRAAFITIREELSKLDSLKSPNFDKPFRLSTDASKEGVGALLEQEDDNGQWRPIAYAATRLKEVMRRGWSTPECEAFAIFWACKRFESYLAWRPFILYSDHRPLKALFNHNASRRVLNWALHLAHLDFTIVYKPGKDMVIPDLLSRYHETPLDSEPADLYEDDALVATTAADIVTTITDAIAGSNAPPQDDLPATAPAPSGMMDPPVADWVDPDPELYESPLDTAPEAQPPLIARAAVAPRPIIRIGGVPVGIKTLTNVEIAEAQRRDEACNTKIEELKAEDNRMPDEDVQDEFVLAPDGCLYQRCVIDDKPHFNLVVPPELQPLLLEQHHNAPQAPHFGWRQALNEMNKRYTWPGMAADIKEYATSCELCQLRKQARCHDRPPLGVIHQNDPDHTWSIDLIGPLPPTTSGNQYICVVINNATRFPSAFPLKSSESAEVIEGFIKHVWQHFGIARELQHDAGSTFTSAEFKSAIAALGAKTRSVTPYRPQANGMVENNNKPIKDALSILKTEYRTDWDTVLPYVIFALRRHVPRTLGFSPFFLTLGKEMPLPQDVARHQDAAAPPAPSEIARKQQRAQDLIRRILEADVAVVQPHEVHERRSRYAVGDLVLISTHHRPQGIVRPALASRFYGPYRITKLASPLTIEVQRTHQRRAQTIRVAVDRVKRFHPRQPLRHPEGLERHIEAIVDRKYAKIAGSRGKTWCYRIKWYGLPASETTWEPQNALDNYADELSKFDEQYGPQDLRAQRRRLRDVPEDDDVIAMDDEDEAQPAEELAPEPNVEAEPEQEQPKAHKPKQRRRRQPRRSGRDQHPADDIPQSPTDEDAPLIDISRIPQSSLFGLRADRDPNDESDVRMIRIESGDTQVHPDQPPAPQQQPQQLPKQLPQQPNDPATGSSPPSVAPQTPRSTAPAGPSAKETAKEQNATRNKRRRMAAKAQREQKTAEVETLKGQVRLTSQHVTEIKDALARIGTGDPRSDRIARHFERVNSILKAIVAANEKIDAIVALAEIKEATVTAMHQRQETHFKELKTLLQTQTTRHQQDVEMITSRLTKVDSRLEQMDKDVRELRRMVRTQPPRASQRSRSRSQSHRASHPKRSRPPSTPPERQQPRDGGACRSQAPYGAATGTPTTKPPAPQQQRSASPCSTSPVPLIATPKTPEDIDM